MMARICRGGTADVKTAAIAPESGVREERRR